MESPWICWAYQYGVGGLLFGASVLLALRAGALRLRHVPDRRLLFALAAALAGAMALHAAWIHAVWP